MPHFRWQRTPQPRPGARPTLNCEATVERQWLGAATTKPDAATSAPHRCVVRARLVGPRSPGGLQARRALCATAARGGHPHEIRNRLYAFYSWCADADISEVTTLAETIATWWPAVEVFLTTGITNARTEGTNRLIKQIKRAACGFRNRENYRRRVRLHYTRHTRDCQRETPRCPLKVEEPL